MNDVLDRLRATNPVTDLDAVEDGVQPLANPAPRSRASRRFSAPRRSMAVAGLLAAVLLAAGLPGNQASGPASVGRIDVASAAAEALDPARSILHIVTKTAQSGPGAQPHTTWRTDVWLAPGARKGRLQITESDGTVLPDVALPIAESSQSRDPISGIRQRLRNGTLKAQGQSVIDGRNVERFSGSDGTPDGEVALYADANTLHPIRSVLKRSGREGRLTAVTDFKTIERLEDTPENRRALRGAKPASPRASRAGQPRGNAATTPNEAP